MASKQSRVRGAGQHLQILVVLCGWSCATAAHAQNRGVYPLGLSAINSGVSAEPGLTYNNAFLFYSRSEQKGADGEVLAKGQQSVLLDMNTFLWASTGEIAMLSGARFSSAVTVPIANNSLSSSAQGAISGGGGFGISTFNRSFLAGAQSASTFAAFSGSWRLPVNSTPARRTT